jgi:hypothetical protein
MTIDYQLKILGEKKDFLPRKEFISPIETSGAKIFEITADNGYGKTFLLNLIGYACFADKLDEKIILKSLKESISRYGDEDSYDLSYNLKLDLPDGKILTLKKESNNDRCFEIDGETKFDYNELHNSLSVLYDVPTDPSERLNAVIEDIGVWNSNLLNKMTQFWEFLRSVQSDFRNIKDELKIKSFIDAIDTLEVEIESKKKSLEQITVSINKLKVYQDLKSLVEEYKSELSLEEKLINSQKAFKKLSKPVQINKKDESVITNLQIEKNKLRNEVQSILKHFLELIDESPELCNLIKGNQYFTDSYNNIRNVEIDKLIISDSYVEDLNKLMKSINQLEEDILLYIRNEEMGKKFVAFHFLKQLLAQIDTLIESEAEEVIEEITKINSNTLIEEIKKNLSLNEMPDYSEIKFFLKDRLPKIKSFITELYKQNSKLNKETGKKGIDEQGEKYYKLKADIDLFKEKIKERSRNIVTLKYPISQALSIDLSLLDGYDKSVNLLNNQKQVINNKEELTDLTGFLKSKNNSLQIKQDEIRKLEDSKKMNEVILDLEQKKSDSKFTDSEQKNINDFIESLTFLIRNIKKFSDVISSIKSGDLSSFTHKADQDFIKVAGKIIAYSMDNKLLRPDGEYIRLENYDMLKKEFQCENEIRIKKDDISTGLASANYLRQRIENTEGDYVIVLLDEIGNMASNTLSEVIKSIKKIENQNRLVLALLTQPMANGIKINEF